jgi:integrase
VAGWLRTPAVGTAPKQSRVMQSRPELRFLTERELETAVRLAKRHGDVLAVTAGTGLRFGEISALWVGDVDLDRGTVRVNKAWKRNGEDDATETPGWLSRQLRAKHTMRDHHLGHPKTPRSRRTITIATAVAALLEKRIEARPADDFVFTSRTGLPLHNGDFYTHIWRKLMTAVAAGEDETVIMRREGGWIRVYRAHHKADTMTTAGHIAKAMRDIDDEARKNDWVRAVVDVPGVGGGVVDRLAELDLPVVPGRTPLR